MAAVRIDLLGGFGVAVGGEPVPDGAWRLRKARTLVKLLALAPGHRVHREQVIAILWEDRAPAAAANNLYQVLHVARRLGVDVRRVDDALELPPVTVDADAFRAAALDALRSGDPQRAAAALALYRGPLLPEDLYEDWTEPLRGELERLRDELSALPPGRARGDNLPAELTTFVGRATELEEIGRLLRRGPLVTLTGAAGCGKTRLAVEVAARQRERFRDGVWLVELAPLAQASLVEDAVAGAAGVALGGRPLEAALAGRELLLVLDNCEHLVSACAELVERLLRACPDIQLLATSREPLQLAGELVHRVPPLPPDDAVRLFADRAAAAGCALTAADSDAVDGICRRLDGVPLAIELAAARAATLAPAEIAERLGDSLRLLHGQPRTLRAALDWSYRLLDAEEAELLRGLAVFAGPFGLDAAEAVCGRGAEFVLVRLASKSLVVAEGSRYRLLEMVRQHAAERLAAAGESERRRERHARFYLRLARDASPQQLDLEADELRAALAWLLEAEPLRALELAGSLSAWWLLRGHLTEGLDWLRAAVARAPQNSAAVADALLRSVPFAGRAAGLAESRRQAERGLAIYRAMGDRGGTARARYSLGMQAWLRGELADARAHLEAARTGALEANALHALGVLAISTHELARARELLEGVDGEPAAPFWVITPGHVPHAGAVVQEESQMVLRRVSGRAAGAYVELNLALVARLEGDPDEARARLGHALARLRARDDEAGVAQALAASGRLATLRGDTAGAHAALRESLVIRRRLGDVRSVGLTLGLLAELAAQGGDPDHARSLLQRAHSLFSEACDQPGLVWMLVALGRLELAAGAPQRARERLEAALTAVEQLGTRVMRGWTVALLAEADLHDAPALAGRHLAEARQDFAACGDPWGLERCDALALAIGSA